MAVEELCESDGVAGGRPARGEGRGLDGGGGWADPLWDAADIHAFHRVEFVFVGDVVFGTLVRAGEWRANRVDSSGGGPSRKGALPNYYRVSDAPANAGKTIHAYASRDGLAALATATGCEFIVLRGADQVGEEKVAKT